MHLLLLTEVVLRHTLIQVDHLPFGERRTVNFFVDLGDVDCVLLVGYLLGCVQRLLLLGLDAHRILLGIYIRVAIILLRQLVEVDLNFLG